MKTLLCYGDSNTWGAVSLPMPGREKPSNGRYAWHERWTGVLQADLGADWRVLENGLNGRTTSFEDPTTDGRDGRKALPQVLETALPVDLLAIMLGTNDCKTAFRLSPWDIALGLEACVGAARRMAADYGANPEILLISPILIPKPTPGLGFGLYIDEAGARTSEGLAEAIGAIAARNACHFLNAADFAQTGPDLLHLDAENHGKLGRAVAQKVREILP